MDTAELVTAGFDGFVEGQCAPYYAAHRGRPSLPPGRYFRMLLVGYFVRVVLAPGQLMLDAGGDARGVSGDYGLCCRQ
jgi:hypothetical protein